VKRIAEQEWGPVVRHDRKRVCPVRLHTYIRWKHAGSKTLEEGVYTGITSTTDPAPWTKVEWYQVRKFKQSKLLAELAAKPLDRPLIEGV